MAAAALVRTDRHRDLRALVSSLFHELARSGRTHGRAFAEQRRSAAHHHFTGSGANGSVMKDHVMMRRFVSVEALFNGRHFDRQIIILCVSWYGTQVSN